MSAEVIHGDCRPNHWLIVGNSPCVIEHTALINGWRGFTAVINKAIDIIAAPDIYFIADPTAIRNFRERAALAKTTGSRIVTIDGRLPPKECDVSIPISAGPVMGHFQRGSYQQAPLSGVLLLQYIANIEPTPTEIHLLGFEGYRSTPTCDASDYWHGAPGNGKSSRNNESCGAFINGVFQAMPETQFFVYGRPVWEVQTAPNVALIAGVT